ncbi:MAG TPA: MlaD family protein [Marmoricola sp.]|jgi:phospholipid/cholesterol/gamma-HCH transport system substrate-binding protein|nr:MlaD family protein [Marmoricola sp.]
MLRRQSRIQLIVFAVIAAVALTVISTAYVRLPQLIGIGQMSITADFPDVTGLYSSARVTYRGVDVGQVKGIEPYRNGVRVKLQVDSGADIPTDAVAEIHSTSAIGEQYVDLVPARSAGPYLSAGDVIPPQRTRPMPQAGDLLDSATQLVNSIPKGQLSSLLDSVTTSFQGEADDLDSLLTDSNLLLKSASQNIGPTTALIQNVAPFLRTQQEVASDVTGSVSNLSSFTGQLVASNSDLVKLLKTSQPFADRFTGLVDSLNTTLPVLLTNMVTTSQVAQAYLPGIEQTLVLLPAGVAGYESALLPYKKSGAVLLDFKLNANSPPACTTGFIPKDQWRDPRITAPTTTPAGIHCTLPHNSISEVRGAHNYPCALYPGVRAASIDECAEIATGKPAPTPVVAYLPGSATSVAKADYEPTTGRFIGPDGQFYALGSSSAGPSPKTWQAFVLSTLGR